MTHTGTLPRKNLFQIFFLFAITFLAFTSTPAFAQLPTITSINPNQGVVTGGTPITITGTNFTGTTDVTIAFASCTSIVVVSPTQITAVTPAGTLGPQDLFVTNASGSSLPATFTYVAVTAPTIISVSPSQGPTSGGTAITIIGTGFTGTTSVTVGFAVATFTVISSTQINAVTPVGTAGAQNVVVTTPSGSATAVGAFTYTAIAPTITTVVPNSGPVSGGTLITITGTNFTGATSVTIGGTAATSFSVVSATQITAVTPVGTVGAKDVAVTTAGGTATFVGGFIYYASGPSITSITPNVGTTDGGTLVIITGTNLLTTTSVSFGTTLATGVVVISSTQVNAVTPANFAGGTVDVTLTFSSGPAVTRLAGYTYVTSLILSFAPTSGPNAGGTIVQIDGLNFSSATHHVDSVAFGRWNNYKTLSQNYQDALATGQATNILPFSSTRIFCTTPAQPSSSSAGLSTIYVHTSNGAIAPSFYGGGFAFLIPAPAATASLGTSTTAVQITWPVIAGATGYQIFRSTTNTNGTNSALNALASTRGNTATSYNDTSASRGIWYAYAVKAVTSTGAGAFGTSSSGWRGVDAPTGVNASQGTFANKVMVKWNAVVGATGYSVYRDGVNITAPTGTVKTTYDDTTAVPSVVYTYTVTANTAGGSSALSDGATGYSTIAAPANVAASDGTSSVQVTVTWDAAAGATGYTILRAIGSATPTEIGTTAALTFDDTTAVPATVYTYTVKSTSAGNVSAASVPTTGFRALAAPTPVTASNGTSTTQVTVAWGASTSAKGYQVFRASGGGDPTLIATLGNVLTYADKTAVVGTLYTYTLFATSPISTSVASAGADGYRNINAPTGVQATDGTSTVQVTVTWATVTGATGYEISRNATLAGTVGAVLTFADTGATPGVQYTYTVKATTSVATSAASAGNTGYRNLSAPTDVAASKGTYTTKIQVTWLATTGASGYSIFRNGATTAIGTTVGNTAVIYNDTTALANKIYYYTVRATTTVATSALSLKAEGYRASAFTDDGHGPEGQKTGGNDGRDIATGGNGAGNGLGNGSENGQTTTTSDDTGPVMGIALYLQTISEHADVFGDCDDASNLAPATTATETSNSATNTDAAQSLNLDSTTTVLNVEVNTDNVHEADNADIGLTISGAIDLDHNGEPDICQLRRGDLDLNGIIDIADMEILLNMVNSEPVLGIGDMDQNDVLDSADVGLLLGQM